MSCVKSCAWLRFLLLYHFDANVITRTDGVLFYASCIIQDDVAMIACGWCACYPDDPAAFALLYEQLCRALDGEVQGLIHDASWVGVVMGYPMSVAHGRYEEISWQIGRAYPLIGVRAGLSTIAMG